MGRGNALGVHVAEDDQIIVEQLILSGWELRQVRRVLSARNPRIAFGQVAFQFDAPIAQQHRLEVPEFPAWRLVHQEHLDFGVDHAQPLRAGIVVFNGLVGPRLDGSFQVKCSCCLRGKPYWYHLLAVAGKRNRPRRHLLIVQLQN